MYIDRQQSIRISLGVVGLFFLIGLVFMNSRNVAPRATEDASVASAPAPEVSPADSASTFTLNTFHRSETKNGKTLWEVNAERGEYFPESNSARMYSATMIFNKKHNQKMQLTASEAEIFLAGTNLSRADARGDVVVVMNDSITLKTDAASYWKASEEIPHDKIKAPGHVRIEGERMEISGEQLEGDLELQEFTLSQNVRSVIKPIQGERK